MEATGSERLGSAAAINRQAHTRSLAFPIFSPPLRKPAAPSPHPPPVVFRQAPPAAPRHWLPPWTPQGSHSPPPPSSEESGVFCVLPFFLVFFLLDNFGGFVDLSAGTRPCRGAGPPPHPRYAAPPTTPPRGTPRGRRSASAARYPRPPRSPLPASYAPRVRAFRWAFPVVIFAILVQSVGAIVSFVWGAPSSALRQSMVGGFWMKLCYLGRGKSHLVRDRLISPSLFLVFVA